jgi:FAD:protein FMN transferase
MERNGFRAMGTEVEILLDGAAGADAWLALAWAESEFERLEAIFSRFREDSELSQLNAEGALDASHELLTVAAAALDARERTGGRFDPTVHDALVVAGYDRSFELLARGPTRVRASAAPAGGEVCIRGSRIELDRGVRLDLGGIAKGYAADRVAGQLASVAPCLVNAGGDIAVAGAPEPGAWAVGVETPDGSVTLALERGALATSGADRRRWQTDDGEQHHLIDPATGRSALSDLLRVTVVAPSAVEAEVLAKALFLAGEEGGAAEADALGVPVLLVTIDGRVRTAGGLA